MLVELSKDELDLVIDGLQEIGEQNEYALSEIRKNGTGADHERSLRAELKATDKLIARLSQVKP